MYRATVMLVLFFAGGLLLFAADKKKPPLPKPSPKPNPYVLSLLGQRLTVAIAILGKCQQRLKNGTEVEKARAEQLQKVLPQLRWNNLDVAGLELMPLLGNPKWQCPDDWFCTAEHKHLALPELIRGVRGRRLLLFTIYQDVGKVLKDAKDLTSKAAVAKTPLSDLATVQDANKMKISRLRDQLAAKRVDPLTKNPLMTASIKILISDLQQAARDQQAAAMALKANDGKQATMKMVTLTKRLSATLAKVCYLHHQIRNAEIELLLVALDSRCRDLVTRQRSLYAGILSLDQAIRKNTDKKATRLQQKESQVLAHKQAELLRQADKIIALIDEDKTALAFAEVFRQVRTDMNEVQKNLHQTKPGKLTQAVAKDIVEMLKEIVTALGKSRGRLGEKA